VVDIEERALGAFEEHAGAFLHFLVEVVDRVCDERFEAFGGGLIFGEDGFIGEGFGAHGTEDAILFLEPGFEDFGEAVGLDEVAHADTGAGGFIGVGGSDATFGSSDFGAALTDFALGVEEPVVGHDDVGGIADEEAAADLDLHIEERIDFLEEADGIDDDAITDDAFFISAEDAGGDEVEDVFFAFDEDGMAGVVATGATDDDIGVFREDVDDLAFTFIAPLGAYQNCVGHNRFWDWHEKAPSRVVGASVAITGA
jgi:hypothetical protein